MKHIKLASSVPSQTVEDTHTNKVMSPLLDDDHCRMVAVALNNGEQLTKHHAAEPISVLCLSGNGIFTAGSDLEESTELMAGTLLTLSAGVEHEVTATPALRILVTKYKAA